MGDDRGCFAFVAREKGNKEASGITSRIPLPSCSPLPSFPPWNKKLPHPLASPFQRGTGGGWGLGGMERGWG